MTPPHGPAFYDDDEVFSVYMARRQRVDSPNDTLEKPVIVELAGDLTGLRILDLGCGDAAFGREALSQGCQMYLGVDGSANMVAVAQQALEGTKAKVVQGTLEDWDYPTEAFDLVLARLVLHYIQGLDSVFRRVHGSLVAGGRFVFSVEHPVITCSDKGWQGLGPRQAWLVDDYFHTGPRSVAWLGGRVVKYHRTVEDYFAGLQQAGCIIEALREAAPVRARFEDETTFQRRQRIPLFLIMAAAKNGLGPGA